MSSHSSARCIIVISLLFASASQAAELRLSSGPQDRPACRLAPTVGHQRHKVPATGVNLSPTNSILNLITRPEDTQNGTAKLQQNDEAYISSPSVVSLPASGGLDAPAGRPRFDSSDRLRQLRQLLLSNNYDGYLVTPKDEHNSEYLADYDRRLSFISGFTGSNGYALILHDRAILFTDGRYALHADQELDCNWGLVVEQGSVQDIASWLHANEAKGLKLATDARFLPMEDFDYLGEQLKQLDCEFVLISHDLVDVVWNNAVKQRVPGVSRPRSQEPIYVHPSQFTGNVSWQEKVTRLADSMAKLKVKHYVMSQLDDIAWLLNLRGNDIPISPLFKAYLIISRSEQVVATSLDQLLSATAQQQQASTAQPSLAEQLIRITLYVDPLKVTGQVRSHLHLGSNGTLVSGPGLSPTRIIVTYIDYDMFIIDIRDKLTQTSSQLLGRADSSDPSISPADQQRALSSQLHGRLALDAKANVAIHIMAKGYEDRVILTESLASQLKSVKSDSEVQNMRNAHWRDSLAISMLLAQLEQDIGQDGLVNKWSEVGAASQLEQYRALMDHYRGFSFESISAYGPQGAIVHYKPNEDGGPRWIGNQSTYLLDCGAQYLDGTTDITRTTHYGEPSEFQRETYTRVLMGAIDMMSLIFKQSSSSSYRINDLLARRYLFEIGLDYPHGTGHGIGLFSQVHEQPALIHQFELGAPRAVDRKRRASRAIAGQSLMVVSDSVPLQPNMFSSVEPGYYKANEFGIRLENIVVTQRLSLPRRPNDRQPPVDSARDGLADRGGPGTPEKGMQFLRFEPISLVPFEPKLIKVDLLSNKQKAWLNSYNLMVRLRMTQQINYYLAKIRQSNQPMTALSSRLYQMTTESSSSKPADPLGYNNFARMDPAKLEEKLEQTHKWIMAKTELIPLDLPASLSGQQQAFSFRSGQRRANDDRSGPVATGSASANANFDGQRLMLAYMSALPFNDREAGQAMAALNARSEPNKVMGAPKTGCSGVECDLWLLGSIVESAETGEESQTGSRAASRQHRRDSAELDGATTALMDLFQVGNSNEGGRIGGQLWPQLTGGWTLGLLSSLLLLQVALVAVFACGSRRRRLSYRAESQGTQSSGAQL